LKRKRLRQIMKRGEREETETDEGWECVKDGDSGGSGEDSVPSRTQEARREMSMRECDREESGDK
jgi:hypothetical protein